MKLGLISDVHGDPVALELAWSHLTVMGADRIVCAGDLVGYGPFPDRVVSFMRERQVSSVRGNHDRWALERGAGSRDEFGGGTPGSDTLDYLRELPADLLVAHQTTIAVVVHGSPRSDMEFVTRQSHPAQRLTPVPRGSAIASCWSSATPISRCGFGVRTDWSSIPAPSSRPRVLTRRGRLLWLISTFWKQRSMMSRAARRSKSIRGIDAVMACVPWAHDIISR